jgi:peptidoglycan/xylan/chitin deacetylase (PgdA/CDA1 family)
MHTLRIVTTSWDDGDPMDLRVAEMLRTRGLLGTFYVPIIGYNGRPILDANDLRGLSSQGFEIGAHGVSHHVLPKFRGKELHREVSICKQRLQDILGDEVKMFCYPKGRYSNRVICELEKTGYAGARTTEMLSCDMDMNPYRIATTLEAFPHKSTDYLRNFARALNVRAALDWAICSRHARNWVAIAKQTFDQVLRKGGIWHLYGHSWIVEEFNLWEDLDQVLDYVSHRDGVSYFRNQDILRFLPSSSQHTAVHTQPTVEK